MGAESKGTICGNCKYWKVDPDQTNFELKGQGECKRYAPSPSFTSSTTKEKDDRDECYWAPRAVYWPLTWARDWCGDWKAKEA